MTIATFNRSASSTFTNLAPSLGTSAAATRSARATAGSTLRIALPQGNAGASVLELLRDAGLRPALGGTAARPLLPLPNSDTKALSPQTTLAMLDAGTRDIGFASSIWIDELGSNVVELLDTGLDAVSVVAAAPADLLTPEGTLPDRELIVASEFERLARAWIGTRDLRARFVRSYGDTQALAPDDANVVVDAFPSLAPRLAPGLALVEDISGGTTRLYASRAALADGAKRKRIEDFVLVVRSVLAARERVMVDVNVDQRSLPDVLAVLPSMREPTIAPLSDNAGFAVRVAVPRTRLVELIPQIKARGGTDIVVTQTSQIVA
jgi:ATP phosphoribosyltransferase-like protein